MTRFHRTAAFGALTCLLALSVAMYAQQARVANTASNVAGNITNDVLRRAGTANDPLPGSWLSYGRTQGETRYSTLKQIDATNVSRLGLAWTYEVSFGGGGNQEATPLVANGILYSVTQWSIAYAVDTRTGKELWRYDPKVDRVVVGPRICCGNVVRGLAIYKDKIYVPVLDGRLVAVRGRAHNRIARV